MVITPGTRLGPYEIISALGAGGMGEVYRAQDARLGRDVAIKVLPATFSADPDRLSRFEQEARAAAALSHPNIAVVHDIGSEGTTRYIVQEYLAGTTLREVLDTQPHKPLREWASVAVGVADGLAEAHRAGIVHRDIKPENVMLAADGHAKVLDFGLAKLTEPTGAASTNAESPTVLGTMAGSVMGTAGYMSPEQAAGQPVDRRTDIFALGCILYEMATNQRPFAGRSVAEVVAHLLHDDPQPAAEVRPDLPAEFDRIIRKCLAKEPARRYQHADDLAVDLRDFAQRGAAARAPATSAVAATPVLAPVWWLAIIVVAVIAALAAGRSLAPPADVLRPVVHFEIPSDSLSATFNRTIAISPDGRLVVRVTSPSESSGLTVRPLDTLIDQVLPGTTGARDPAVSADNRDVAFWSSGQIKRTPIEGGAVLAVGPMPSRPLGMSWADDGYIYVGRGEEGVWRIDAGGGTLEQVLPVDPGQLAHGPQRLSGDWVLFTRATRVNGWNDAEIVAVSLSSKESRVLVSAGHDGRWVPGFVTYARNEALFAQPIDDRTLQSTGSAVLIVEGVGTSSMQMTGAAFYDVSRTGVLAYNLGTEAGLKQLVWIANGVITPLPIAPVYVGQVALSPDGRKIAARVFDNGWQIWVYDVERTEGTKLTSEGSNRQPVWSPDSLWVYYASDAHGELDIWRRRADSASAAELVFGEPGNQFPAGLTPDGRWLVFVRLDPNGSDIGQIDLEQPPQVEMLLDSPSDEVFAAVSPDGRFVAYQTDESGEWQIKVIERATKRQWTVAQGYTPVWSKDGRTILYQTANQQRPVAAVPVDTSQDFSWGASFVVTTRATAVNECCDLMSRDRVLFIDVLEGANPTPPVGVIVNWPQTITR